MAIDIWTSPNSIVPVNTKNAPSNTFNSSTFPPSSKIHFSQIYFIFHTFTTAENVINPLHLPAFFCTGPMPIGLQRFSIPLRHGPLHPDRPDFHSAISANLRSARHLSGRNLQSGMSHAGTTKNPFPSWKGAAVSFKKAFLQLLLFSADFYHLHADDEGGQCAHNA